MRCTDFLFRAKAITGAVLGATAGLTQPVFAQDTNAASISVELSSAESLETGCRLSFFAQNSTETDLTHVVFEAVLFDADGRVAQMTLLDFKDLPTNRPRVRQFQFGGKSCGDISRILINGAATCEGGDASVCATGLSVSSRADMELLG